MNTTLTRCTYCQASMFFYMEWECQSNFAKYFDFLCTITHMLNQNIHKKGLINFTIQAVVRDDYPFGINPTMFQHKNVGLWTPSLCPMFLQSDNYNTKLIKHQDNSFLYDHRGNC